MRIAIIDQGTNSVRFDVHQLGPSLSKKAATRLLHREKIMVRLGQGVFLDGKLEPNAIQRTLHAYVRFKKVAEQLRVSKILAFGTSALREVIDRDDFVRILEEHTGIQLKVISGMEEAKLIALGILGNEKLPKAKFALIDIGGGSTEISICQSKTAQLSQSFPLGTARLQQVFLKSNPPEKASIIALRRHVRGTLLQEIGAEDWPKTQNALGSSGTIRTLAKILSKKEKNGQFKKEKLSELVLKMSSMNTTELLGISGMESKRVDMILAGAILLEECMNVLGIKELRASEYSLRDGIFEEERKLFQQGESSHLALHLGDLLDKACSFGADREHLLRVKALGDAVFKKLKALHRLGSEWQIYLTAGIFLRDTGEAISLLRHTEHSKYIVQNTDLPPMEKWENEFISMLCFLHEGQKVDPKLFPFSKNKIRHEAFKKILAILRLVDALDSGMDNLIKLDQVRNSYSEVKLILSGAQLSGFEVLKVEKQAEFFERVFKRKIYAEERN